MLRILLIVAAALALMASNVLAQQWLTSLPRQPAGELTFQDYKQAFENYYQQHPVPLEKEKITPTFRYTEAEEITDRVAIEQYKFFKRWEWLMEPRTYPTGKLDMKAIETIREMVPEQDNHCLLYTSDAADE